jgi:CheY-like chemotaxis protein
VRQLVELHRGTVSAESSGERAGTTIKVMLPLTSLDDDPNAAKKKRLKSGMNGPTTEHSLNGMRVLVVDDEPDSRELVAAILATVGAEVSSVGSATEALDQMEQQRFDLLISDIGMPDMNGYELIGKVRQLSEEHGGRIPAAALTPAPESRLKRALAAGYENAPFRSLFEAADLITVATFLAERHIGLA